MNEELALMITGDRFPKLLQRPLPARMCGYIAMQDFPGSHFHDQEAVKESNSALSSVMVQAH